MTWDRISHLIDEYGKAIRKAENLVHTQTKHGEFTEALDVVMIRRRQLEAAIKEFGRTRAPAIHR